MWREFFIDELFSVESTISGIDRNKLNGRKGAIPYITRTEKDNGMDDFIGIQEGHNVDKPNTITIGLDTQTVFYQSSEFYTGQNIQLLRNKELNKHVALFLIPLIKTQLKKFNWGGNGATLTRLRRSKIQIPVDTFNKPNYKLMEELMKTVELRSLKRYISYLENVS